MSSKLSDFRVLISTEIKSSLGMPRSPLLGLDEIYLYHLGLADGKGNPANQMKGKMIRPAMCMAVCAGCGKNPLVAVSPAAALELIHRTSLIFDDIQDKGLERNNQPAAWKVFSSEQAINAGLALSCFGRLTAMRMKNFCYSEGNILDVLEILENAVIDLTRGQYSDISFEGQMSVPFPIYQEMIDRKTGALFGAACEIGGYCGNQPEIWRAAARRFGILLGRVFQMQDDYLGIWGDAGEVGKTSNDLAEGKRSLPVVIAMEEYPDKVIPWLEALKVVPEDSGAMRSWLESMCIDKEAKAVISSHAQQAKKLLADLGMSKSWADEFDQLLDFVISRAK